jgi:hypothetical protein
VILHAGSAPVYSPWFPGRGDYLRATAELVANYVHGLRVDLFTKNRRQKNDGLIVDSTTHIILSSTGRSTQEWNSSTGIGIREFVRYRFSVYVANPPADTNAWIAFRMLMPCWFDAVLSSVA